MRSNPAFFPTRSFDGPVRQGSVIDPAAEAGPGRFAALRRLVEEWRRRARSRAELARCSDHELRDFTIDAAAARAERNKPFWQP